MINKSNRRFLKFSFNRYNKSIVWFPVKELMAVGNELMTGRFKRNIKSNSYLVHYRPYQGANKGKQVASSTKWGLRDNVVLRLMECLTPTVISDLFTDNYFIRWLLCANFFFAFWTNSGKFLNYQFYSLKNEKTYHVNVPTLTQTQKLRIIQFAK